MFLPETQWEVPAITAGTPLPRIFRRDFPNEPEPWVDEIFVDNRSSSATLILVVNGIPKRIGPGQTLELDRAGAGGAIYAYTLDATANTGANDVTVFERSLQRDDPREGSYRGS